MINTNINTVNDMHINEINNDINSLIDTLTVDLTVSEELPEWFYKTVNIIL